MALALLDLPFKAAEHKTEFKGTQMTLTAGSPMIVFHEEIQPAAKVAEHTPILVSQNFFRNGDRYRQENGEQVDKFVTDEFLVDTVYGCQVVVTNPTSSKKKLDVLVQIPTGALAGLERPGHPQRPSRPRAVPHADARILLLLPGRRQIRALPGASGQQRRGARRSPRRSRSTWSSSSPRSTSNRGTTSRSTARRTTCSSSSRRENMLRVNLDRIAWRMQDKAFFDKVIDLLAARHVYNNTLWSYGVKHDDVAGDPAVPAVRRRLRAAMRRLARQPAVDDRPGRPPCLRAHGIQAAGQRPGRPARPQARDSQRPLLGPVPAVAEDLSATAGSWTTTS